MPALLGRLISQPTAAARPPRHQRRHRASAA